MSPWKLLLAGAIWLVGSSVLYVATYWLVYRQLPEWTP